MSGKLFHRHCRRSFSFLMTHGIYFTLNHLSSAPIMNFFYIIRFISAYYRILDGYQCGGSLAMRCSDVNVGVSFSFTCQRVHLHLVNW